MIYVSADTVEFQYTIPTKLHLNSSALRYHLEICNVSAKQKSFLSNPTVTPAQAPTAGLPNGVPGLVTFTGLSLTVEGIYMVTVYYANNNDLDMPNVKLVRVGGQTIRRVTPVSVVEA